MTSEQNRGAVVLVEYDMEVYPPGLIVDRGVWAWMIEAKEGNDPDPTEATLACAEALGEVIGGRG